MEPIKIINEDRLLKLIHNFFEEPQTLIVELVQNAVRAKAKNITINTSGDKLSVTDDGEGCGAAAPLLTLAESDWCAEIEQNQQPAGWGMFVLYCLSKEVEIASTFGTLRFNTEAFLNDAGYRKNVASLIETDAAPKGIGGFAITATLKTVKLAQEIVGINDERLQYFPIDITINGKSVKRSSIQEDGKGFLIKTSYMGNDVFIGDSRQQFPRSIGDFAVIWHGMYIPNTSYGVKGIINVTCNSPLTPVLPFRTSIKQDEKLGKFWDSIRLEIVGYCINRINDSKTGDPLQLMATMEDLATQDETDRLNRFFVDKRQPYFYCNTWNGCHETERSIVSKGEKIISHSIKACLVKDGKEVPLEDEDILVPKDVIYSRTLRRKSPGWLKIEENICNVDIYFTEGDKPYRGNMLWCKAKIASSLGLDLDIIGVSDGMCTGDMTIYYGSNAKDARYLGMTDYFYSGDGDSYDTQADYIERAIEEDISNINKAYCVGDLLKGFREVRGMKICDIKNIAISKKKVRITLKRNKELVLSLS